MGDALSALVWTVIITTIVVVTMVVLFLWLLLRRQRQRNRIGRDDRYTAPLSWLYVPGEAPRLHRRILSSVAAAKRAASMIDGRRMSPSGVHEIVAQLEEHAGAVDDGLILAFRLPTVRRHEALARLRPAVGEIEAISERMVRLATEWDHGTVRELDMGRMNERLDALERAHEEVTALERALGR